MLVEQVLGVPWPAESLLDLVPEWLVKELAQNQLGLEAEVHWKALCMVNLPAQELAQEEQGEVELCILVALVLAPPRHHHRTHQAEESEHPTLNPSQAGCLTPPRFPRP